jgi:hypothetical protein
MNSFNTFHATVNRSNIPYKPGLYFNIYQGYHDEVANYDSIAPQKVGYTSGYTSDTTNKRIATNNQLPVALDYSASLYTVVWNGLFRSNYTGTYTFRLISDDGSHLWLGENAKSGYTQDNALIKNGGLHGDVTVTATYTMAAGAYYPIRILFGENYGGDDFSFSWSINGGTTYVSNGTGFFFNDYVPITPNTDKLVLWYTFLNDGAITDNMGNYNGTNSGATFDTVNKKVGSASMAFAGNNTGNKPYIDVADLPASLTDQNALSFSFWFRSTSSTTTWGRIFDFGNGAANDNIIAFIENTNFGLSVYDGGNAGNNYGFINNANDNVWRHCVWVLVPGTWRVYINGALSATKTTGIYFPRSVNRTINYIGRSNWDGDPGYNGNIDDFRIYKEALTQEKVSILFSYGRKNYTNNLLLWYTFDTATISGTTVTDYTGNYNGTLQNSATTSTTTVIKGTASLYLQNTNTQHVSIPTFTVSSSLSFSFWINPAITNNTNCIFDSANAVDPNANNIVIYLNANKLGFSYNVNRYNERNDWYYSHNLTDIPINTWTHVVIASYPSGSNNIIKVYKNNVLTTTNTITPGNANFSAAILPWARQSNFIGKTNTSGYNTYSGYIDDFRIYNEVLTEDKIDILYNNYW